MIPLTITVSGGTGSVTFSSRLGMIFLFCIQPPSSTSTYAIEFTDPNSFGLDGRPDDGSSVLTGNRTFESRIPIIGTNTVTISGATNGTYTVELFLQRGI